jgi:hypothetical protein
LVLAVVAEGHVVAAVAVEIAGQNPVDCRLADAAPAADAFRPPYAGNDKTVLYREAQLDYTALASLSPGAGAPSMGAIAPRFQRVWLDHVSSWTSRYMHPIQNMPDLFAFISDLQFIRRSSTTSHSALHTSHVFVFRSTLVPGTVEEVLVPITAHWNAFTLTLAELSNLEIGSVLPLPISILEQTSIVVGSEEKFIGTIGIEGERIAVSITSAIR